MMLPQQAGEPSALRTQPLYPLLLMAANPEPSDSVSFSLFAVGSGVSVAVAWTLLVSAETGLLFGGEVLVELYVLRGTRVLEEVGTASGMPVGSGDVHANAKSAISAVKLNSSRRLNVTRDLH